MTLSHNLVKTSISPALWSPHSPTLYLLRTEILDADNSDAVLYTQDTTIGFRTFKVSGTNFHLNSKPIYLRGYPHIDAGPLPDSVQEDPNYIDAHFTKFKNMNLNWVRSIDLRDSWLDSMDEKGIMGVGGSYTGGGTYDPDIWFRSFKQVWREIYEKRHHPSIVMWCLGNEWHINDATMSASAKKVYDRVNSLDPSRVEFNAWAGGKYDAYFPGTNPAVTVGSDFLDHHPYNGWYGGDWTDWYESKNDSSYPTTATECVGVGCERDPNNNGVTTSMTKAISSALRRIGDAYDWGEESNWYCAFNTRGTCEEQRRGRDSTHSMCGSMPFNNLFEYPYYYNTNDTSEIIKPVGDALTEAYEPLHISIRTRFPNQFAGTGMPVDFIIMNDDLANWDPSLPASTLYVQLLDPSETSVWTTSYAVTAINYYSSWKSTQTINIPANLTDEGIYHVAAQLKYNGVQVASTQVPVFIAPATWVDISHSSSPNIAVYDSVSGNPTITMLNSLSVPLTEITVFSGLSGYDSLVIGYDSFDSTVASAESAILSFINSGKRVLVLQQIGSTQISNLNASSWLGTSITTSLYDDSFVNIVRQQDPTLMDGLYPDDFRFWNSTQSGLPILADVFSAYFTVSDSDMSSKVAVLANGYFHLKFFHVIEIFPSGGTGGSCILSQLNLINAQYMPDPLAQKFLANLVDYTMESRAHYKNVSVDRKIVFSDLESENGIFWSAIQQGMTLGGTSPFYMPDGRDFRGKMVSGGTGGALSEDTPDAIEKCPMYIRAPFAIGDSNIIVDVQNKNSITLGYRLIFNGAVANPDWVQVSPGTRVQSEFTLPSVIPANTDIKFEIEAEEGTHEEIHKGLKFYSIQLADPPKERSLVAHYALDGNANDATGNYDGVAFSADAIMDWQPTESAPVLQGGSLYFAGGAVPDSVTCGDVPLSRAATTITYWAKAYSLANVEPINKQVAGTSGVGLRIGFRSNGTVRLWTGSAGANTYDVLEADTGVSYAVNVWVHHAWVFDSSAIRFYVDGLLRCTKTATREINAPGVDLLLGRWYLTTYPYRGNLDDVRVYDTALSSLDVSRIAQGKNLCLGNLSYDLTDDCVVNLNDFAILASGWLDSFDLSGVAMMASEWLECDTEEIGVCP